MFGYPAETFRADNAITRAEVAAILYRLQDTSGVNRSAQSSFTDIASDAWYAEYVNVLASLGMVTGYPDGTFMPNQFITRAEFTTILVRFTGASDVSSVNMFNDLSTQHWAYTFIIQALANGWIAGYPDGTFRADDNITRAEAATIVNVVINRIPYRDLLTFTGIFDEVYNHHWAFIDIALATEHIIWYK